MNAGDIMQYALAAIIVIAAAMAVVRSIVRSARGEKSTLTACAGCKLQDVCQRPEKNSLKKCDDKVAQIKKP